MLLNASLDARELGRFEAERQVNDREYLLGSSQVRQLHESNFESKMNINNSTSTLNYLIN